MALLRFIAALIAVEALFYVLIGLYIRSLRRESLEKEWNRRHPDLMGEGPERRAFVERSMQGFNRSIRARMVGLVFVLPTVAIVVIAWFVNHR
ncbi:MAG: hypothetical protein Q4G24_01380 [Paracoccus sp. (in: a-proteobacteria)]|uniref:hypothetical protein n=1 Tax=Paracoccus sp. TaxID=267 RepID=UPI0026E05EDB|nr:hypothetical protein [Paracoccus sp. (in: a-proteobacteria)]MDO5620102.1 hypothetical protein [Paracoccus sp. (in: a-proteobacteria)]